MAAGILWDNDGVLVDTEGLYFQANREVLASVGIDLTSQDFARLSLGKGSLFDLAVARGLGPTRIEALREERNTRYGTLLAAGVVPRPGIEATLERLSGRTRMGVVTSSRREHFDLIHQRSGLMRYFEFVLAGGDYTHYKPHPEPYLLGLVRLGLPAGEVVAIEDSERGLRAALAAGLRCVVMPNALSPDADYAGATHLCRDGEELAAALSDLGVE